MKYIYIILLILLFGTCRKKQDEIVTLFPGKPQVPLSLKKDHKDLLEKIRKISVFRDSTGRSAVKLGELMQHHFAEEEDYVLPQLGLLPMLASGGRPENPENVMQLSYKLRSQMPHLSAEHQLIKAFMNELVEIAAKEGHPEAILLDNDLKSHADLEEELLFPMAILIGEYLKFESD